MDDSNTYLIDLRPRTIEQRKVREGKAMHSEFRSNIINFDNSVVEGEWIRIGTIPNYGDVFDKKPFWQRLFGKHTGEG